MTGGEWSTSSAGGVKGMSGAGVEEQDEECGVESGRWICMGSSGRIEGLLVVALWVEIGVNKVAVRQVQHENQSSRACVCVRCVTEVHSAVSDLHCMDTVVGGAGNRKRVVTGLSGWCGAGTRRPNAGSDGC